MLFRQLVDAFLCSGQGDRAFSSRALARTRVVCYRKCFSLHHFQSLHLLSWMGPDPTPHSARLGVCSQVSVIQAAFPELLFLGESVLDLSWSGGMRVDSDPAQVWTDKEPMTLVIDISQ